MIFNITKNDVQTKLSPSRDANEFHVNDVFSNDEFNDIVKVFEDKVLSSLPYKYRRSLTHISEALTYNNKTLTNTYQLSLSPINNSLKVYINLIRPWENRTDDDLTDINYTLSNSTITFSQNIPLGYKIYAEYDHNSAETLSALRDIVVNYIAIEISKRTYLHRSNDPANERLESWKSESDDYLDRLQKGLIGIVALDNINYVNDKKTSGNVVDDFYEFALRL
jgi:hypothetical protein